VLIPGADQAIAATAYAGIPRQLVAALKFRGRLSVARPMAAAIAAAIGLPPDAAVVPVPAASSRQRRRGFDPADEIAAALSRLTGRPFLRCLKRTDGPRQVGRARRDRLASPPRVWASGPVPPAALLVDDVVTTGATLAACALALRTAGATEVRAAAFARSVGPAGPGSSPLAALGAARDRA
jgi:ComF family protein